MVEARIAMPLAHHSGGVTRVLKEFANSDFIFLEVGKSTSSARLGSEGQLSEFIEGLGPGQLVGRQVLASPALGAIQLSMCDSRGHLEVEVIRAKGLQCKAGSKTLPGITKMLSLILTYLLMYFSF